MRSRKIEQPALEKRGSFGRLRMEPVCIRSFKSREAGSGPRGWRGLRERGGSLGKKLIAAENRKFGCQPD